MPARTLARTFEAHAGESIQAAINQAQAGDRIRIHAGTYTEHLFLKDYITLEGVSAQDGTKPVLTRNLPVHTGDTIKNLTLTGIVYTHSSNARDQVFEDLDIRNYLTITGSYNKLINSKITYNNTNSYSFSGTPALTINGGHNEIVGNLIRMTGNTDYAVRIYSNNEGANLFNGNTIAGTNRSNHRYALIISRTSGTPDKVVNTITYGTTYDMLASGAATELSYSLLSKGQKFGNFTLGSGIILNQDPMFVWPAGGDFHLKTGSLARNAGDPAGNRRDIGAYSALMPANAIQTATNKNFYYLVEGNALKLYEKKTDGTVLTRILYQGSGIDPTAVRVDVAPDSLVVVYSYSSQTPGPTTIQRLATGEKTVLASRTYEIRFTDYREVALNVGSSVATYDLNTLQPFNFNITEQSRTSPNGIWTVKDERVIGRLLVKKTAASGGSVELGFDVSEMPVTAYEITNRGIYYVDGSAKPPVLKFVSFTVIQSSANSVPLSARTVLKLPVVPRDRNAIKVVRGKDMAWIADAEGQIKLVDLINLKILTTTPTASNPNFVYTVTTESSPLVNATVYTVVKVDGSSAVSFIRTLSYGYATSNSTINSLGAPDVSPDGLYAIHPYQTSCTVSSSSCGTRQYVEARSMTGALVATIALRATTDPLTQARFVSGRFIRVAFSSGAIEYYDVTDGQRVYRTNSNASYYYQVKGNQLLLHQVNANGTVTTRVLYQGSGIDPAAVVVDVASNGSAVVYSWSNQAQGPTEILKLSNGQKVSISERTYAISFTAYNEVALDTYSWDAVVYDLNTLTQFNYNITPVEQFRNSPNGMLTVKDERSIGRLLISAYGSAAKQLILPITESPVVSYTVTDHGIYYVSGHDNPPAVKFVSLSTITSSVNTIPEIGKEKMNLPIMPRDRAAVELVKNTGLAWITNARGLRQLVELDRGVIVTTTPTRSNPNYKIVEEMTSTASSSSPMTEVLYHILDAAGKRVATYVKSRYFSVAMSTDSIQSLALPDVSVDGRYVIHGYESWCTRASSSCARKQQVAVQDLTTGGMVLIALKDINADRAKEVRFLANNLIQVIYQSGAVEYYTAAGQKV